MEGRNLFFKCFIQLVEPIAASVQVTWTLNGNVIRSTGDPNSRIQITDDETSDGLQVASILIFTPARLSDAGLLQFNFSHLS